MVKITSDRIISRAVGFLRIEKIAIDFESAPVEIQVTQERIIMRHLVTIDIDRFLLHVEILMSSKDLEKFIFRGTLALTFVVLKVGSEK